MVGAHKNLNGSSDLNTTLSEVGFHLWLALATVNLSTKFEVSTHYKDIKGDTKCQNGVVWDS